MALSNLSRAHAKRLHISALSWGLPCLLSPVFSPQSSIVSLDDPGLSAHYQLRLYFGISASSLGIKVSEERMLLVLLTVLIYSHLVLRRGADGLGGCVSQRSVCPKSPIVLLVLLLVSFVVTKLRCLVYHLPASMFSVQMLPPCMLSEKALFSILKEGSVLLPFFFFNY